MKQELRIFISSTFLDLAQEREHLVKRIFPEIRQICRSRGVEFTEIDLRWGVTNEEAQLGKVLPSCLDEIDNCRPFFLGILGDRYGWIPPFHEIQKDPKIIQMHPWLEDAAFDGWSFVEMEIYYAALRDPKQAEDALFYFRTNPRTTDTSDAKRLRNLRVKIERAGLPYHWFGTPQELGVQVRESLIALIDKHWPVASPGTETESETRAHSAFAANRRRAYIADPDRVRLLTNAVTDGGSPVLVTGPSGMGKSSLLAFFESYLKRRHPELVVLSHYIGATPGGTHSGSIIRRLLMQLRELHENPEELPPHADQQIEVLPLWLSKVRAMVVIVFDALNELDNSSASLNWLPSFLPDNVRLIASTTDPSRVSNREWQTIELSPLTTGEREALIVRYLGEYHKSLTLQQCSDLASHEQCASPLFLRVLLEELRLTGDHETLSGYLKSYVTAQDLPALFQLVLARIEKDFHTIDISKLFKLIWASRRGLTESEIIHLTGISRLDLTQVLVGLEYHLIQRDGHVSFFHVHLQSAVQKRYLQGVEREHEAHAELARHFRFQSPSPRRAQEEPWQWREAGDLEQVRLAITDPENLRYFAGDGLQQYEFLGYWLLFEDKKALAKEVVKRSTELEHVDKEERALYYEKVGSFLNLAGEYEEAATLLEQAVKLLEKSTDELRRASAMTRLGELYESTAKYDKAEKLYLDALDVRSRLLGENHPDIADSIERYGTLLYYKGEHTRAEQQFRKLIDLSQLSYGMHSVQSAKGHNLLGAALLAQSRLEEAESAWRFALAIDREADPDSKAVADDLNNLSVVLDQRGDTSAAIEKLSGAINILSKIKGPNHKDVLPLLLNLAYYNKSLNNLEAAEQNLRRVVAGASAHLENHPLTATALGNLALVRARLGDLAESKLLNEQALAIFDVILPPNHDSILNCMRSLYGVLRDLGETEKAKEVIEERKRREGLTGLEPSSYTIEALAEIESRLVKK